MSIEGNNGMNLIWSWLYKLSSPRCCYDVMGRLIPWFTVLGIMTFTYGVISGLYLAPADYQQGDAFRIIYLHVPAAFLSLFIYSFMAFCAVLTLIWRIKLADMVIKISASLGAWFTFLALFTGALWGKPMWGTWWIWDARLTSELILLFLYIGCIALRSAMLDQQQAARAVAIMVLVGAIDIPIIHYSVQWWSTLHQGATLSKFAVPSIAPSMLYPLLSMMVAFFAYFAAVLCARLRTELLQRERKTQWVKQRFLNDGTV